MGGRSSVVEYPPFYPHDGTYADMLEWHLKYWGTRPDPDKITNGLPWDYDEFRLSAFPKNSQDSARTGLNNWLGAKGAPNKTSHSLIQKALFGDYPIFEKWREDFEVARKNSPKGVNRRTRKYLAPPPPHSLSWSHSVECAVPRETAYFTGRHTEVDEIVSALLSTDAPNAILLQGGPGIGKTELTKAIAHHKDVAAHFGKRRFFVSLELAKTANDMWNVIAHTLDLQSNYNYMGRLNTSKENKTLVVLDGLESPWENFEERDSIAEILADLSDRVGFSLLASFRGYDVVDGARWKFHFLNPLSKNQSIDLFTEIAGRRFLTDKFLSRFINVVDGVPLAINLVARRVRGLDELKVAWKEWQRIGVGFAEENGSIKIRNDSLAQSIKFSLDSSALSLAGLKLIRLLGHSNNGIDRNDLAGLLGRDAYIAEENLRILGLLHIANNRTRILQPIKEYVKRELMLSRADKISWIRYFHDLHVKLHGRYQKDSSKKNRNIYLKNRLSYKDAIVFNKEIYLEDLLDEYEKSFRLENNEVNRARHLATKAELYLVRSEVDLAERHAQDYFKIEEKYQNHEEAARMRGILIISDHLKKLITKVENYSLEFRRIGIDLRKYPDISLHLKDEDEG